MRIPDGFPLYPFPGMRPFEPADSDIFFGQDENIEALIEKLGSGHFVAVLGESGVGKSSLVKAGLVPELRRGNTSSWHVPMFKPGTAPLEELAAALVNEGLACGAASRDVVTRLRLNRAALKDILNEAAFVLPPDDRILIVVDQFEELFRFRRPDDPRFAESTVPGTSREEDAALFVKLLLTAAKTSAPPIYVLATMRSEFLGDCSAFYELGEAMNQGAFLLPRMTREQYTAAVTEPLQAYGCEIEPALLHELLNETMAMAEDGLPLLQHALRRIWDGRAGQSERPLDLADFMPSEELLAKHPEKSPIQVLLDAHLDEVYGELEREGLGDSAARLVQFLGEYDHKGRLVRRPADWDTARAIAFREDGRDRGTDRTNEGLSRIVGAFRNADLGRSFLRCEAGPTRRETSDTGVNDCALLELSHEVIFRQWTRLADWFRKEKKNAEYFQYLAQRANRFPLQEGVLTGDALGSSEKWVANFAPTKVWAERYSQYDQRTKTFLYDLERTIRFIGESVRSRRNRGIRNAALVILVIGVAFAGWLTFREQGRRAEARIKAEIAKQRNIRTSAENEKIQIQTALQTATGDLRIQLERQLKEKDKKIGDADLRTRSLQSQVETASTADQKTINDLQAQVATLTAQRNLFQTALLQESQERAMVAALKAADSKEFERLKTEYVRLLKERQTVPETDKLGPPTGTIRDGGDGLKYIWIRAGTFMMGCSGEAECSPNEKPAHAVTISKGFWIGQTPVTVVAWNTYARAKKLTTRTAPDQTPVVSVSWNDAQNYCQSAGGLRLPTEAQWEFAARAGTTGPRYGDLERIAMRGSLSTVPSMEKNAWNLYNMLGSVWQWTSDWSADKYLGGHETDPKGPEKGQYRTLRGGSWLDAAQWVRASYRDWGFPGDRYVDWGFRCVGE